MGKEFDVSDFDCGMIVGCRFSHIHKSIGFGDSSAKKEKKGKITTP